MSKKYFDDDIVVGRFTVIAVMFTLTILLWVVNSLNDRVKALEERPPTVQQLNVVPASYTIASPALTIQQGAVQSF